MKKQDANKRQSGYNPNRSQYLSKDGKYYCYTYWDDNAKRMVTQKLEIGKEITPELARLLDELDHDMDLNNRYEGELRDPLFDAMVAFNNKDFVDPWDALADKTGSVEDVLFAEDEPENPLAKQVRRIIDEGCTESQRDLFFGHFGMGMQLETLRQAEAQRTGKLPSSAAMSNRKNKIVDKAAKALGVDRVQRRKHLKD